MKKWGMFFSDVDILVSLLYSLGLISCNWGHLELEMVRF